LITPIRDPKTKSSEATKKLNPQQLGVKMKKAAYTLPHKASAAFLLSVTAKVKLQVYII